MPDSYFNLTNKSDLINRIQYDFIRFCDHLVVANLSCATLYNNYLTPIFH